jgi:hypothetical protein
MKVWVDGLMFVCAHESVRLCACMRVCVYVRNCVGFCDLLRAFWGVRVGRAHSGGTLFCTLSI